LFVAFLMLAVLGIGGLTLADDALTQLYQAQLQPVAAIGKIEARLERQPRHHAGTAGAAWCPGGAPQALDGQITKLRANRDEIHALLGQLTAWTPRWPSKRAAGHRADPLHRRRSAPGGTGGGARRPGPGRPAGGPDGAAAGAAATAAAGGCATR
jgi:hypothetical protein